MKHITLIGIILIICAIVIGGYYMFFAQEKISNLPPKNDKIAFFGDSLAEGIGATEGHDLVSVIAQRTGKEVSNFGVKGNTTSDALLRIADVTEVDPGLVVIILGGNDVLQKIPKEETFRNLEHIIEAFHAQGAGVMLVGVRSGVVGDGRGDDFDALAKKTGAVYVSDILQDVFAKRAYMSDTVHPNDAGYAIIADRMVPIIEELFSNE